MKLTPDYLRTIAQARVQTQRILEKAQSYSPEFQKPEQIRFYTAMLAYLDELEAGKGERAVKPQVDPALWDVTQCVLDARAATKRGG